MALSSRLKAFHRQIEVFSAFLEILSASKSAAAFDGAATRTLISITNYFFYFFFQILPEQMNRSESNGPVQQESAFSQSQLVQK